MKMPSDTVYFQSARVVGAESDIGLDWTEWATQALIEGFDSKYLRKLAASTPDEGKVLHFVDLALTELGIPPITRQDAKNIFISGLLHRMLIGRIERKDALYILAGLYYTYDNDEDFRQFYYFRDDYLYALEGCFDCCSSLFNTSTENLEKVVDDFAREWLRTHNLYQET